MPRAKIETAHTLANRIAAILRANDVKAPSPTPELPCSLEYLIENAFRKVGRDLGQTRIQVDCGGDLFPEFVYPEG